MCAARTRHLWPRLKWAVVLFGMTALQVRADCRTSCLAELRAHPSSSTRGVEWQHVEKAAPCESALFAAPAEGSAAQPASVELRAPRDAEFIAGSVQLRDYEGLSTVKFSPTALRVSSRCSASRLAAWRVSARLRMSNTAACAHRCEGASAAASRRPQVLSCTGDQMSCVLRP
jgi:hypothetical protein